MKTSEKLISAVLTIVLGLLFIIWKSSIIGWAMTVFGIVAIVLGVLNLIDKKVPAGVIKIVFGVLIIACGWLIRSVVLYILAALLLIYGILMLYGYIKKRVRGAKLLANILLYAKPVLLIVIGLLLFFNQTGAMNAIFVIAGIVTVVEGVLMLVEAFKK